MWWWKFIIIFGLIFSLEFVCMLRLVFGLMVSM
jgi:hypothetical protein